MRLITAVASAERAMVLAKKRGAMRPRAQGICWSAPGIEIDPGTLQAGEYIAVDIDVSATGKGSYSDGRWCAPTLRITRTERVTTDEADRGRVLRGDAQIGVVVEVVSTVINIHYDAGCDPTAPAACQQCGAELGSDPAGHACARTAGKR